MTQYHYTRDKAYAFDAGDNNKAFAYTSKDDFSRACISFIDVDGERKITKNSESDIVFYVTTGEGTIVVNGTAFAVKATDSVIVPKNVEFGYFGKMGLVEFMTPSWVEGSDIEINKSPRDHV
ncbi:MAG TPA: hypothetical protein VGF14_07020 [Alphaproteobacteria bacterium]